jgi:hypothetical protein
MSALPKSPDILKFEPRSPIVQGAAPLDLAGRLHALENVVTQLSGEFRDYFLQTQISKERLYEENFDLQTHVAQLRQERDDLKRQLAAFEAVAAQPEDADLECAFESVADGKAQCSARVQGMWVPVAFDAQVLAPHGLQPGMRFHWRVRSSGPILSRDITPHPTPQLSEEEQAEYDRLFQRFLDRHPELDEAGDTSD